ncbi:unnamed protein product [Vicia faba]|uniref:F-box domain-containing protein n=1 Tax=Vicia faba TaxID=3906 RepID=A0AAV1AIE2_VICFA|nr:unnamed protein product [Vicia faba]
MNDLDKLSDFSDSILIHILSFLNTKDSVQTSILSKRWNHVWKYIPLLTFIESRLLGRFACHVLSHNVKLFRLRINVKCDIAHVLPCISSCHTLTSLKLYVSPKGCHNYGRTIFPKSLNLPALTSLHLGNFAFGANDDGRIDPFSPMFCGSSLSSIKQVNIDVEMLANYSEPPAILLSWLQELANVKSLTVSASTLQVLSFIPNLLKLKISSLHSLKSLKVKLKPLSYGLSMALKIVNLEKTLKAGFEPSSPIPDGILNFFLQNSPSADVDIIDCLRFDDSSDHLPPLSSLLFAQYLQPSSHENAMEDLHQRIEF